MKETIDRYNNLTSEKKEIFRKKLLAANIDIDQYLSRFPQINRHIVPSEKKEYYALSHSQMGLFFIQSAFPESISYNCCFTNIFENKEDINIVKECIEKLCQRHEILRSKYSIIDGVPQMIIVEDYVIELAYKDVEVLSTKHLYENYIRPHNLEEVPVRAEIYNLPDKKYLLLFDFHHIVVDSHSLSILQNELNQLLSGKVLPALKLQFKEYSEWQSSLRRNNKYRTQEKFWIEHFGGNVPLLNLPYDFARPAIFEFNKGNIRKKSIIGEDLQKLRQFTSNNNLTTFHVLLGIYYLLLHKLSNQDEIIVGIPLQGRNSPVVQESVGMFVNTMAVKKTIHEKEKVFDFIQETKDLVLDILENQDYVFTELVDKLNIPQDPSRNPIFDVMFDMLSYTQYAHGDDKIEITDSREEIFASQYDLAVIVIETNNTISLCFRYCTALFEESSILRFIDFYLKILDSVLNQRDITIAETKLLTNEEKYKILREFNNTESDTGYINKSLHSIFEDKAKSSPDKIAVIFKDQVITYRQLDEESDRLCYALMAKGVEQGSIVGIMLERSIEMMNGIFAILKAGCAYLPVDLSHPAERVKFILKDSKVKTLLVNGNPEFDCDEICDIINLADKELYLTKPAVKVKTTPDQIAYVIYTSGSTGKPKGVLIEHQSVINRIIWMQTMYPIGSDDTILQKTTFTFDVSVWELFWWFFNESKVCLLEPYGEKDTRSIIETVSRNNITTIHFVPSMLKVFLQTIREDNDKISRLKSLKYVFSSGEALTVNQANLFNRLLFESNKIKLINLYGPTEATVDVSYFNCDSENRLQIIPIGKPIQNIKLYVVSKTGELQSIGIPGELYISGIGVARGYLNRVELTNEKFVKDPFTPGKLMYKTGDLARYLPDGNIEFLGRLDFQVKLRGFRIELGEIENVLSKFQNINNTVVSVRKMKDGDEKLIAYYISDIPIPSLKIRKFLKQYLQEYMIPSQFVKVDSIPLNTNGKVDKAKLDTINITDEVSRKVVLPSTPIEKSIADIFMEELELKKIGVNQSFFEIGGTSILAMKILFRLEKELKIKITTQRFYLQPTIQEILAFIKTVSN